MTDDFKSDQKPYSKYAALHCQTNEPKNKSSAQVETLVSPRVVSPKSGGLKPGRKRCIRLMGRFSKEEQLVVLSKAMAAKLSINEYVRASVLGAGYVSTIDPVKQQLLRDISRELGRQGNNLNQVARQLNAEIITGDQGNSVLTMLGRSLLSAHKSVRQALAEGQVEG